MIPRLVSIQTRSGDDLTPPLAKRECPTSERIYRRRRNEVVAVPIREFYEPEDGLNVEHAPDWRDWLYFAGLIVAIVAVLMLATLLHQDEPAYRVYPDQWAVIQHVEFKDELLLLSKED